MITVPREQFKVDDVYNKLYLLIQKNHKVSSHTHMTLIENRRTENFCEEARHYVELPMHGKPSIYISYDISSWLHKESVIDQRDAVNVRIDTINIYEDYLEWNSERLNKLHGSKTAFIPNLN